MQALIALYHAIPVKFVIELNFGSLVDLRSHGGPLRSPQCNVMQLICCGYDIIVIGGGGSFPVRLTVWM